MATPAVGADIESLCTKCGDVWHVVVAKVGEKIAKVQCKQCSGFHRHRPLPNGATQAAAPKTPGVKKARAKAAPKALEPTVKADSSRPLRRYVPSERFDPGDRVEHLQFGTGVVESSPGPGKMQVCFPTGRRVLVMGRAATAGLERPGSAPTITDD